MRDISVLTDGAAKLLLHYVDTDGETLPLDEIRAATGISRATYFRAKAQLRELGYIDRKGNLLWRAAAPTVSAVEAVTEPAPPVIGPAAPVRIEPVVADEPQTLRQRAMQADLMDDSGDWSSSNSPRRKRRLAQIRVVQDAWDEMFGEQLTPDNAKDFIGWNDDSAEAVLEVFEDCKRRVETGYVKTPLSWLRSKFIRRAKETPQPQVKPADIGPVREDEGALLAEPSESYKRKQAKIKQIMAARGNDGWDD